MSRLPRYLQANGNAIPFRAKYDRWEISVNDPIMADDGTQLEAWIRDEGRYFYRRTANYGEPGQHRASYMAYETAQDFVERCLLEYVAGLRGEFTGEPAPFPITDKGMPARLIVWDNNTATGASL